MTSLRTWCGKLLLGCKNPFRSAPNPDNTHDCDLLGMALSVSDKCCCPECWKCCDCDCRFPVAPNIPFAPNDPKGLLNPVGIGTFELGLNSYRGGLTQLVDFKSVKWRTAYTTETGFVAAAGKVRDWHLETIYFQMGESIHSLEICRDYCAKEYILLSGCNFYVPLCSEVYEIDPYCPPDCDPCDGPSIEAAISACCGEGFIIGRGGPSLFLFNFKKMCAHDYCDEFITTDCVAACKSGQCSYTYDIDTQSWQLTFPCPGGCTCESPPTGGAPHGWVLNERCGGTGDRYACGMERGGDFCKINWDPNVPLTGEWDSIPGFCQNCNVCYGCNEMCYRDNQFDQTPARGATFRYRGCLIGGETNCHAAFWNGGDPGVGNWGQHPPSQDILECDECIGTCTFAWNAVTETWDLESNDCGQAEIGCICPDPPSDPGLFGEKRDLECKEPW